MLKNMKLGMRLGLSFGLILVMLSAVGIYAVIHINELSQSIGVVVNDRMTKVRQTNNLIENLNVASRAQRNMLLLEDPKEILKEKARIDAASASNASTYDSLEATIKSEEGKKLLASTIGARKTYAASRGELIDLTLKGDRAQAIAMLFGSYRKAQNGYIDTLTRFVQYQEDLARKDGADAAAAAARLELILIAVIAGLVVAASLIAWMLTRSLTGPIGQCMAVAEKVSRGETDMEIRVDSSDETGALLGSMKTMVEAIRRMTLDAAMLSQAAGEGRLSVRADASRHNGDFRKIVQGVNDTLDSVIGPLNVAAKCVDEISKGNIPTKITDTYHGDFNRIKDNLNTCIDAVNALVKDADLLVQAAVAGNLSVRADASRHSGDFRKVVQGVNDTLDSVIGPLNVAARYVDEISKGNIPAKITDNYNGDFNSIKNNLNVCIDAVNALVKDADMLVQAAVAGRLSTRADTSRHSGDFRKVVQGVNDTLDAVIGPVNEAAGVLEKVAARDLTVRMEGHYQGDLAKIKDALNAAVQNLDGALSQVSSSTQQVAAASGQISSGSQNLAEGANEQASSLEEVSASLEEMASMTRQNADNANRARTVSQEADMRAKEGTNAMGRMSESIEKIKTSSDQTAKIVKTIDEIAMQTNLLALNAAVEAARAGEAGRGFAVVAEEVRNLAQRSAQAAKNTADMIAESVKNANDGVKISLEVARSFDQITTSVKTVNELIAEIATASKEQSAGITQVNDAVSQMDKVTQQNAANAEESASASEELSSQAAELKAMVGQFVIQGGTSSRMPVIATPRKSPRVESIVSIPLENTRHLVAADQVIPMDDEALTRF